jgi:hypothetical protein
MAGPGCQKRGKDKQSMPKKGRDNLGEGRGGTIKSDMMEEDQREQSEQSSDQAKFCQT